jgi:hypothetical protein
VTHQEQPQKSVPAEVTGTTQKLFSDRFIGSGHRRARVTRYVCGQRCATTADELERSHCAENIDP